MENLTGLPHSNTYNNNKNKCLLFSGRDTIELRIVS